MPYVFPQNFQTQKKFQCTNSVSHNYQGIKHICAPLTDIYFTCSWTLLAYFSFAGPSGSESTGVHNASLINNIQLIWKYFLHALEISRTPQKIKQNSVQWKWNHIWCATMHMHKLPNLPCQSTQSESTQYTANTEFSLKCRICQWIWWKYTDRHKPDFYDNLPNH